MTAISAGSTVITATTVEGGFSAECAVTVLTCPLVTVYLDGQNGDDSNSGVSPAEAVKTFARAKSLLSPNNGTIFITGLVVISVPEVWDLSA